VVILDLLRVKETADLFKLSRGVVRAPASRARCLHWLARGKCLATPGLHRSEGVGGK
jgi:hypothetical protein